MVIKRSPGGESAGGGRSTSKSTYAVPAWSLTAFCDQPVSSMSKFSARVNSDLVNGSFWLEIRDAEHVDRCSSKCTRVSRVNRPLTSQMFIFQNMLAMVVSEKDIQSRCGCLTGASEPSRAAARFCFLRSDSQPPAMKGFFQPLFGSTLCCQTEKGDLSTLMRQRVWISGSETLFRTFHVFNCHWLPNCNGRGLLKESSFGAYVCLK